MQVTQLFTSYVGVLLNEASSNREANWKSKDAAMYLITALAVRGKTAAQGATATNQLFNIKEFYQSQVSMLSQLFDRRMRSLSSELDYRTSLCSWFQLMLSSVLDQGAETRDQDASET